MYRPTDPVLTIHEDSGERRFDDPPLLGQVVITEVLHSLLDQIEARRVEEVLEALPLGGENRSAVRGGAEHGDVTAPQVPLFRRDEPGKMRTPRRFYPEPIEEAITFECVTQQIRVEALVPEEAVYVRRADYGACLIMGEPRQLLGQQSRLVLAEQTVHPGEASEDGVTVVHDVDILVAQTRPVLAHRKLDTPPDQPHLIGTWSFPADEPMGVHLARLPAQAAHVDADGIFV